MHIFKTPKKVPDTFFAFLVIGLLVPLAFAVPVGAQGAGEDVVVLRPTGVGESGARVRGEVIDYTGEVLRLRTSGGAERKIPAAQVERVETKTSAEEQAADELFARGDFGGALSRYRTALEASREPRQWVRREILAQIVWCQRNLGQWDQAGEHFLILLASDPQSPHFACLPLAWTEQPPSAAVARKAGEWLRDAERPAAVLIGASQLLNTDERGAALEALRGLLSQRDRRIAWLAYAQLFRAGSHNATDEQWSSFADKIELADPSLRAGAYYILGSARAKGDPQRAAIELMKLPILYPQEYELSARALVQAGECLQQSGSSGQAEALYREVLGRFGQSPAAQQAREQLESLATTGPAGKN